MPRNARVRMLVVTAGVGGAMSNLDELQNMMRMLRAPVTGCPWDCAQTFASLLPYTLEEAYEVVDVVERGRFAQLPGELGDLLFQVIFYSQLAEEAALFSLDDVITTLRAKLRERHPHVFGDERVADAATVSKLWEARKAHARQERDRGTAVSELDDVPLNLPALTRARKLQQRAARVGFDWPDVSGAWLKLGEEVTELEEALTAGDEAAIKAELGDLLFAAVNVARHIDQDAEAALRAASHKFERRFRSVEEALAVRGAKMETSTPALLDELWEAVKRREE